ncbi:MAG: response regulator [Candidatus Cloacimonetes bacterium]|nr:response regulator [Candidatus Cloacimonadota bacterium]
MNLLQAFINRTKTSLVYKYAIVFLLGALAPVFLLGAWSFWMSHRALHMHISDSAYQALKEKIDYSSLLLQETESLIANISSVEDISLTLSQESAELGAFDKLRLQAKIGYILSGYINIPGLEAIDIFSANGNQYHVGESLQQTSKHNLVMVEQLVKENQESPNSIVWHGIRQNYNHPDQFSLIASRRLSAFDPVTMDEIHLGTIFVQYSVTAFNQKFIKNVQSGVTYIIIDAMGNCIYSPNPDDIGLPYFQRNKLEKKSSAPNFVDARLNNQKVFLLTFKTEYNGWQYYSMLHSEYLQRVNGANTKGTLIILGIILILSIVINGNFFRYLLQPINTITNALQEISANRYNLHSKLPNPHHDEVGELIKWFNSFTDNLIEKENYQNELHTQKELAERANEAKSTFLANISHELRTPLNGVIAVAVLMEKTSLNSEQKDYLHTMLQSGDILYSLINQVLDYSKIASNKMEMKPTSFDIVKCCDKLVSIYCLQAEIKGLKFNYGKPHDASLIVDADELALQKIIINLLGNSLKFTRQGEISFNLSWQITSTNMAIVTLKVADTGIGIAPEKQELIFRAFEQADSALAKDYEGTGLGLAIAQQLAQMMGSHIMMQSPNPEVIDPQNPGSVFWLKISLPLAYSQVPANKMLKPTFEPNVAIRFSRPLITLIVEDNQINQKVLSSILNKFGIDSVLASDWMECMDIVQKRKFDYIFMDIQMPGKTGLELTKIIREKDKVTIIIAITGNALKEIEEQAFACGMNAFLVKPIRSNELEEVIIRFLPKDCKVIS